MIQRSSAARGAGQGVRDRWGMAQRGREGIGHAHPHSPYRPLFVFAVEILQAAVTDVKPEMVCNRASHEENENRVVGRRQKTM